ncbi:hypothetical protein E2320_001174, partial [Naja naja]
MAAGSSDEEDEELVTVGTPLELLEEGERIKKPVPLQDQTVKDEKGRYKRFHGAFSGGFSAGYFNTVGSKEGWAPSAFVSSRQNRAEKKILEPEDFMDEEDLGEHGIAPKEITITDAFASQSKDKIQEKARQLAGIYWMSSLHLQKPGVKIYGCALPPGSEDSEEEEDEYQPENVTFAPKDVMPVDLTPKENLHGLGYKGLDPNKALFGTSEEPFNLFSLGPENLSHLGDVRHGKGRKLGISGQTKSREMGYMVGQPPSLIKASQTYPPPDLPRDYRPIHYFRPVIKATAENSHLLQALAESTGKLLSDTAVQSPTTSVLEYLSDKDKERIQEVKQAIQPQRKTDTVPQQAPSNKFHAPPASDVPHVPESCLDAGMTEWEQSREREEFSRAAAFYKTSSSILSSRFTPAKLEDDTDKTNVDDKVAAAKMKMFGKLTREKFEWHPDKLLCKRFNVPDPYADPHQGYKINQRKQECNKIMFLTPKKSSRWDVPDREKKKDTISEFISLARSKVDVQEQLPKAPSGPPSGPSEAAVEEESRPSMDLFKAIFASSSDEKSSSEEESEGEEPAATALEGESENAKPCDSPGVPLPVAQETEVTPETFDTITPTSKEVVDQGEFGPRLPPVAYSGTADVVAEQKPQKIKEKHKRKEHKHKKEKDEEFSTCKVIAWIAFLDSKQISSMMADHLYKALLMSCKYSIGLEKRKTKILHSAKDSILRETMKMLHFNDKKHEKNLNKLSLLIFHATLSNILLRELNSQLLHSC